MRANPSYVIKDSGIQLALRDLDDTSLTYDIEIDGKNLDSKKLHNPHINRNHVTVR